MWFCHRASPWGCRVGKSLMSRRHMVKPWTCATYHVMFVQQRTHFVTYFRSLGRRVCSAQQLAHREDKGKGPGDAKRVQRPHE